MIYVCFSEGSPLTSTFCVHLHADARVTELVEVVLRFSDYFTFEWSLAVLATSGADSIKLEYLTSLVHRLHTPKQTSVGREDVLSNWRSQQRVDFSGIACESVTHKATSVAVHWLEHSEERIFLLSSLVSLLQVLSLWSFFGRNL